jgi:two-component system NtrC family sensor kinase
VRDSGLGITKKNLDNVLKPFFTTKAPGEGTGLGLAICQEIIKKYGGRIELTSREGSWTLVQVIIPYEGVK